MLRLATPVIAALLLFQSPVCAESGTDNIDGAITAFSEMRAGWNRGDIDAALAAYWDSPEITWVNRKGISHGIDEFASEMRSEYADSPEAMGHYSAEILDSRLLSEDTALLVARWDITLDGKRLFGGVSSMVWKIIDGQWKLVFEHAS